MTIVRALALGLTLTGFLCQCTGTKPDFSYQADAESSLMTSSPVQAEATISLPGRNRISED